MLVIDDKNNKRPNLEISKEIAVSRSADEVQETDSQKEKRSRPMTT
jgi:hypothetical protein